MGNPKYDGAIVPFVNPMKKVKNTLLQKGLYLDRVDKKFYNYKSQWFMIGDYFA